MKPVLHGAAALLAGGVLLAGCGNGGGIAAAGAVNVLVAMAPTVQPSPTVFLMGLPATEVLPGGQRVKLVVGGPALSSPVKGGKVQFAPDIVETFTITATVAGNAPVTFTPADFVVRRVGAVDAELSGPAAKVVTPGQTRTWKISVVQTPGQGLLVWRHAGTTLGSFSFVAEND